jgi:hypothetical protein
VVFYHVLFELAGRKRASSSARFRAGWLWIALGGPRARSLQVALDGCGWLSLWVALGVALEGWSAVLAGLYKAFPPPNSVHIFSHFLCTFDAAFQEEFRDKYGRKTAQFSAILLGKTIKTPKP